MRLNDENAVFIESGFAPTDYVRALVESMLGFRGQLIEAINHVEGADTPQARALAIKFYETGVALRFLVDVFPESEHESGLIHLTEAMERSAANARETKGQDWNPDYDLTELSTEETVFAFYILIARDLRAILDQIELDRITGETS